MIEADPKRHPPAAVRAYWNTCRGALDTRCPFGTKHHGTRQHGRNPWSKCQL